MIRLEKLRKEYDDLVAVNDLDLIIPEGQIYGLIGPNGAGKTTTIRMACGLLEPTEGKVHVSDVDIHQEPERAQQFIGYLSDFFSVYEDLKVWEYLDYFAHAYKMPEPQIPSRIDEIIQQVGLEVKHDAMIKGLSRGMKQRLGIARAVIHKPKVLLLDEPASGLDPKARIDLRNLLLKLRDGGSTILISSHILTELEGFCSSIGIMEKGRLLRSGTIEGITMAESAHRTLRLQWNGDFAAQVQSHLAAQSGVTNVAIGGAKNDTAVLQLAGGDEDIARILAALVGAGVPVIQFGEVKQTVEDLYMKLSHHEVM